MLYYFKPYLHLIVFTFICILFSIASILLLIPLSKTLPDVFSGNSIKGFINLSFAVIVIYFFRGIFSYFQNYLSGLVSVKLSSAVRKDIYKLILENSFESFCKKRAGEIITILTDDVNKIREMIFSVLSEFIPSAITLFFTIGYIFYINWRLSLFVFILIPSIGGVISLFTRLIREKAEKIQSRISDTYSALHENFVNFQIIKVFGFERLKINEFSKLEEHNNHENLISVKLVSMQPSVIGLVQVTGICIIACYGGYEMIKGKLVLAELLAFGTALSLTIEPVIFLTKSLGIINRFGISLRRALLLKSELEPEIKSESGKINAFHEYSIAFNEVSFTYPNNENYALNKISFMIKQGETIAFSGDNGSGKSTIAKLILGLYENFSGKIKIGNNSISDYETNILKDRIKACFHEPFLFHGTIRENILINCENISEQEFFNICSTTGVSSFIKDFSEGFDYHIGEFGNKLSSGQKQRVALARSIISKPSILILDEATSALDLETEEHVYKQIREFLPETTIIIVNHRTGSLKSCDRIYAIKKGEFDLSSEKGGSKKRV